ncbi:hypothetical protein ACH0AH_05435 [Microbacterium paludicola]|uniref:hypothetical protein n=1 Tax=Microbacterium paludicola TaxID=300019 RepID=UPI003879AE20
MTDPRTDHLDDPAEPSAPRGTEAVPAAPAPPAPAETAPTDSSLKKRFDLSRVNWKRVGILTAIGIVTAVVLFVLIWNFAPVWWARIIGDFVQEDFGRAVLVGLIVGFGFTLVPLMVLLLLLYRSPVWVKIALVVLAVVLATPNLLTLWIEIGASSATHAADRIIDTEAFAFGGASVWGAVIGALAFLFWAWLFVSRRRTKKQLATLKANTAG